MKNTIQDFFRTETYFVNVGYRAHISRAPEFATQAVVEDADGKKNLIDISDVDYRDAEDFICAVVERYEE